jgi:hypothetical protein
MDERVGGQTSSNPLLLANLCRAEWYASNVALLTDQPPNTVLAVLPSPRYTEVIPPH